MISVVMALSLNYLAPSLIFWRRSIRITLCSLFAPSLARPSRLKRRITHMLSRENTHTVPLTCIFHIRRRLSFPHAPLSSPLPLPFPGRDGVPEKILWPPRPGGFSRIEMKARASTSRGRLASSFRALSRRSDVGIGKTTRCWPFGCTLFVILLRAHVNGAVFSTRYLYEFTRNSSDDWPKHCFHGTIWWDYCQIICKY